MKFMKRTKIYKAANVTFDPSKIEAHSYVWWKFVAKVEGKVIFNDYRYSVTTAKHQRQVRQLMQDLDIPIYEFLQIPDGIKEHQSLKELRQIHDQELDHQRETQEEKRIARNEKARQRRQLAKIAAFTKTTGLSVVGKAV